MRMLLVEEMRMLAAADVAYGVTDAGREFFVGPRYRAVEDFMGCFEVSDISNPARPALVESGLTRAQMIRRLTVK